MSVFSKLLPENHVLLDLDASSKKRVFEQAGLLFENQLGIARATVFDSLFAREKLGSTGLGQGIAIPHGRIKGLKQATGLPSSAWLNRYPSSPRTAARSICSSCSWYPSQATEEHLQILSELAQRFSERSFREGLLAAPDVAAIIALFKPIG